jgi:hypothetical protein
MKIRSGQEAKHDLRNLVAARTSRVGVLERGPRIKARRENSALGKSWAEKDLAQTKSTHAKLMNQRENPEQDCGRPKNRTTKATWDTCRED